MTDAHAHLKDNLWRELAPIDAALAAGTIDEATWHRRIAELVVPAYLAAATPPGGSGHSGDWARARRPVLEALDRAGTFLDVGCANGLLLESVAAWSQHEIDPHGLEIVPELADLARARLPQWAERIHVGNALSWEPPGRFTYARTNLEYAPPARRGELVERLLSYADRVIVGVFNEERGARPTEQLLRSLGFEIAGRRDVPHPAKREVDYRVLWLDA
ncbi:MAG: hypothetical protein ABR569_00005 [Gaiellaceae bacterium]